MPSAWLVSAYHPDRKNPFGYRLSIRGDGTKARLDGSDAGHGDPAGTEYESRAPLGHARPDHPALTMNGPPPASYREPHSALNRPLLAYGLVAPAAAGITCLILGVVTGQPWFFVIMAALLVPAMIWTTLLYRNWPTGIRFDASAISIGAIGSARAASRTPTVNHQSRGLFTCPGRPWRACGSSPTGPSCGR